MKIAFVLDKERICPKVRIVLTMDNGDQFEAEIWGVMSQAAGRMVSERLSKEFEEQFMPRPATLMSVGEAVEAGLIKVRSMPLSIEEAVEKGIIHQPVAALGEVAVAVPPARAAWYVRAWRWVVGLWPFEWENERRR